MRTMGSLVFFLLVFAGGFGLPKFQMALYFNSLQANSNLPPQKGEYLRNSFRTEVLVPFSNAIVTAVGRLDARLASLENSSLTFRVSFCTGLVALGLAMVAVIIRKGKHIVNHNNEIKNQS